MSVIPEKKLAYILNYVIEDDVQHFVHVLNLLDAMKAFGWSIFLISEKGGDGVRRVGNHDVHYLSRNGKTERIVRLIGVLFRLRRNGYRLVYVRISKIPAIIASLFGFILGMKVVYWQSGISKDFDAKSPPFQRISNSLQMWLVVKLVHRFVTGPERMVEYYAREYLVPRHKLMLLYNDIDGATFRPERNDAIDSGTVKILFVHSFSHTRAALMYFAPIIAAINRAVADGHRIRFDLIGEGGERPAVERVIAQGKPTAEVNILGAVPNVRLPAFYADADIFIMPTYREGMSRALMEAMSAGVPAVSTDAGGTLDMVGPLQAAFVVSRDDPEAFADRLFALICDSDMRRAIAHENLETIQRYSTENVARMYDERLAGLLA
jgi:glycosyltransferase involved in cell wall biosynthesis